ncbi:MAG: PAS domain S-box protein [Deltaproteobacteria bacterium]|nr:PAS domain S-box protein [Deltaproteobacteria bacterium]
MDQEHKRRRRERIIVLIIFAFLIILTAVEVHLLSLSHKLPFVNSIFFFGLMNINVVLTMLLLFLLFRNVVKLVLDDRRGRVGSRLKTKLVVCFILFSIIPTVLLFTISALYIKSSFDKWFSVKVGSTLQKSIEVVRNYYDNTEKNASHFARKLAFALDGVSRSPEPLIRKLQEARMEYGLDAVEYYSNPFSERIVSVHPERADVVPAATLETLQRAFSGVNECRVQNVGLGELIRCGAFLGVGKGVIFANYFIPMGLASQLSEISLTYEDFKSHNPLNYPIKSTYFAILTMVTLLILFSATWIGFYMAKRLTVPLEELSRGTEEIAKGNLDYEIPVSGNDEMARLMESFNQMTKDLSQNKRDIERTHAHLKRMNEELSHRRRYIEVLLESVQSGVISLDENGRMSMVNHAAAELLQLPAQDLIGKPYWAIIPEEHRAEFREILVSVYGNAKPVRKELKIRSAKDEWVTLLVTLSVLREESKKQMGVVAVFDDVTDIQKMQRMIAWREVARRIAHEIKNPLTPIQLSVQRLRRRYLDKITDDGTFGQATDIILKEVDSLKKLVSEFSSFARLPETLQAPDDLNAIVIESINLFRAAHEEIVFKLNLYDSLPSMELDRSQLKRALINLFDNAVAAMNGRGSITVSTMHDKDLGLISLAVSDEGCGISAGISNQLFEPYFSTKEGGTGLGLAIVQKIISDHGGFVRALPNRPRGSRFVIEFPDSLIVAGMRGKRGVVHETVSAEENA